MTDVLTDLDAPPVYEPELGEDDPEYAHIVSIGDLARSQITGEAIQALCGKMWVPKRNPDDYPLCSRCLQVFSGDT